MRSPVRSDSPGIGSSLPSTRTLGADPAVRRRSLPLRSHRIWSHGSIASTGSDDNISTSIKAEEPEAPGTLQAPRVHISKTQSVQANRRRTQSGRAAGLGSDVVDERSRGALGDRGNLKHAHATDVGN